MAPPGTHTGFSRKAAASAWLKRSAKNAQEEKYAALAVPQAEGKLTQCCRPGKYSGKQALAAAMFRLRDSHAAVRAHAMDALAKLASKSKGSQSKTMGYVVPRLVDDAPTVRIKAVETITGLVEKGDQKATNAVLFRIHDEDPVVRAAAVKALAQIARVGVPSVINALVELVKDPCTEVRMETVVTLGKICERGDQTAVNAVKILVQDKDAAVRLGALQALAAILSSSDRWGVQAIVGSLDDPDKHVRRAAVCAMKDAAAQGQEPLIMALCARLEDGDSAVQAAAVESLVALIDDSTRELAIREAISRCQRPGGHIREAAIQILGKIAERGDQRASEAAASLLDDQDDRVRAAAIDACGRVLTVKGHRQTVEKILKEISHTKAFVRRAVVDAVAVITEQRDTKGRDCLLQGCIDVSANVRKSAIVALMGRCNDGDNEALMTALNHLSEQEDHGVRRASAALLSKVARSSDKNAMDAVISFLGEEDDSIRGSGLQAMERFCTGNMARGVLSRIISLLEHHRAATRTEISEFLSNIFAQREDVKNDVLEVCKMLDNRSNFNTRRVAADTLKKAAAKGSVNTVDAVSGLLNDANPQVRRMAVEILSAASQAGSEAAKLALTDAAAVEGSSDLVRQAAEEIMLKTGITGQDPSMGLFSPKTGPKK